MIITSFSSQFYARMIQLPLLETKGMQTTQSGVGILVQKKHIHSDCSTRRQ